MIILDENVHDALLEMFNIGVGYAAETISRMLCDEVVMEVPSFKLLEYREAKDHDAFSQKNRLCAVTQRVSGIFDSEATLLFAGERAEKIVEMIVRQTTGEDFRFQGDQSIVIQEALVELSNIVLNGCVGSIANMLSLEFDIDLPTYRELYYQDLFDDIAPTEGQEQMVLLLLIDLRLQRINANGNLFFVMDMPAMDSLMANIRKLIDKY